MILVTGATGHLGKATIDFLLKKNVSTPIVALARDKEKIAQTNIEIREGDYNDYNSLVKAFSGVDKLFFVSSSDIPHRGVQQRNVVKAAREAGVKHIIYTSLPYKTEEGLAPLGEVAAVHLETEKLIKESGIPYTILRNNIYAEMIPFFIGENVSETGQVFFPAGDGKVPFISRIELAEASATLLTQEGHENKVYNFAAPASYSFEDIAKELSTILGKTIAYPKPSLDEYKAVTTQLGVPAEYIQLFSMFGQTMGNSELDIPDFTVEKLIGRKPTSLAEFLKGVYGN